MNGFQLGHDTGQDCLYLQAGPCSSSAAVQAWNTITTTQEDSQGNFYDDYVCGFIKSNGNGFRCFDKPKPPTSKEQAIERYTTEYPPETICAPLKQNSPFRCLPAESPPSTKEQAIERYASEYSPEAICEPLKYNSPFQCTRTVEAPMVTRMSLSLATAQAVFALVGVLFVSVLRKIKKSDPKSASHSNDRMLRPHWQDRCGHRSCAPHESAPGGGRDTRNQRAESPSSNLRQLDHLLDRHHRARGVLFARAVEDLDGADIADA